jgi:membrane protein
MRLGAVLRETARDVVTDRVSLAAAGCAFYATLALFPALSMVVAAYGLVFDLQTVSPQLEYVRGLVPGEAFTLIANLVQALVTERPGALTYRLVIGTAIALWSSTTGTKSILGALNLAYEVREARSFLRYQRTAFLLTIGGMAAAVLGIALLVLLPAMEAFVGITSSRVLLGEIVPALLVAGFVMLSLCLLYRFGPSRPAVGWRWVLPGAVSATVAWLGASRLFSWYVGHMASYDATYGPLGAVVGLMMWFFVSAFVVLAGAELNAACEAAYAADAAPAAP